jgi:hypothetical protein
MSHGSRNVFGTCILWYRYSFGRGNWTLIIAVFMNVLLLPVVHFRADRSLLENNTDCLVQRWALSPYTICCRTWSSRIHVVWRCEGTGLCRMYWKFVALKIKYLYYGQCIVCCCMLQGRNRPVCGTGTLTFRSRSAHGQGFIPIIDTGKSYGTPALFTVLWTRFRNWNSRDKTVILLLFVQIFFRRTTATTWVPRDVSLAVGVNRCI